MLTLVCADNMGDYLAQNAHDAVFTDTSIAERLLRLVEGFFEASHSALHLDDATSILGCETTGRRVATLVAGSLLWHDGFALGTSGQAQIMGSDTHFDTVKIGLAAGLEVGVLEFPDLESQWQEHETLNSRSP